MTLFRIVFVLCFCLGVLSSTLSAAPKNVEYLEKKFKTGLQHEQLRLYSDASQTYLEIAKTLLEKSKKSTGLDADYFPLLISSGVRLSVVTAKDMYKNMYPLVHQLESFKQVNNIIDDVFSLIIAYRQDDTTLLSRDLYVELLFSRAYNRIAWSNKLLLGTPWKNYIVLPTQDIISMLDLAIDDLEQYLEFEGVVNTLSRQPRRLLSTRNNDMNYEFFLDQYKNKMTAIEKQSLVFRTKELINFQSDPQLLAAIGAKRSFYQAYQIINLYRSKKSQHILSYGRTKLTYDAITNEDNQPLYNLFHDFIEKLSIL